MPASKHRRKKAKRASKNPGKGKVIRPASEYSGARPAHADPDDPNAAHDPFRVTERNRFFFGFVAAGAAMFFAIVIWKLVTNS